PQPADPRPAPPTATPAPAPAAAAASPAPPPAPAARPPAPTPTAAMPSGSGERPAYATYPPATGLSSGGQGVPGHGGGAANGNRNLILAAAGLFALVLLLVILLVNQSDDDAGGNGGNGGGTPGTTGTTDDDTTDTTEDDDTTDTSIELLGLDPLPGDDWNDEARQVFVDTCVTVPEFSDAAEMTTATPEDLCGCVHDEMRDQGVTFEDFNTMYVAADMTQIPDGNTAVAAMQDVVVACALEYIDLDDIDAG
ncbi:MAG TPA: hypothetical protein VIL36_03395, partial [Acidimicrobiales bacterium]